MKEQPQGVTSLFTKTLSLAVFYLLAACMGPELPQQGAPIRTGFPLDELWVINGLSETVGLVNLERLATGTEPYYVNPVFLAGRVPNRITLDGTNGLIVNSTGNSLTVFDLRSPERRRDLLLPAGSNPWEARILHRDGRSWILVTTFLRNSLCVFDLGTGLLTREIILTNGSRPEGLAISEGQAWIAMTGWNFSTGGYDPGMVSVLDLTGSDPAFWREVAAIAVDENPQVVLADQSGQIHVLSTGRYSRAAGCVTVFTSTTRLRIGRIQTGGSPQSLAFDTSTGTMHLAGGSTYASYQVDTLSVSTRPAIASVLQTCDISAIALDSVRRLLFAADFARDRIMLLDLDELQAPRIIPAGDGPVALGLGRTW